MSNFKLNTLETAPEESKEILSAELEKNGFIPNLYGIMSESPELLKAYKQMQQLFSETSFSQVENNIVWLTVSYHNCCHYCMAIHTMVAKLYKLPDEMIEALRENKPLNDPKLETLRKFTAILVEKRGWATEEEIQEFLNAGYSSKNVLELIIGVGQKILSNYVNHLAHTPIDQQVEEFKWDPAKNNCAG